MYMDSILVLTPTLGTRESLATTIETVRTIGGSRVRHVVVCPADRVADIEACYGVECLAEPHDCHGIYQALNYGFATLGHDHSYLTFINDDDYWLPNYKLLLDAVADGRPDLVYGKVDFDMGGRIVGMACSGRYTDFVALLHHRIVLFTQQAAILRSSAFFAVGGFDEHYRLVADTLLWARLSMRHLHCRYIGRVCARCDMGDGRLSSDADLQLREHCRMMDSLPRLHRSQVGWAVVRFRVHNIPVYVRRVAKALLAGHRHFRIR